jgi:hypothetical protein
MATYTDQSRLFSIELPDGFERDLRAKSLVFRHPDVDGTITVSCLRHELDDAKVNLFDALPSRQQMQAIQRARRDETDIVYGEYEGEIQNQPEQWRWWTLQRGPVGMVVSFNGEPDQDPSLVDAFVAGVSIAAHPPLSSEQFTRRAAAIYAASFNKPAPAIKRSLELAVTGDSILHLDNIYTGYLSAWDGDPHTDADEMLSQWLEQTWGSGTAELGPFEDIRGLLCPVVKARGFGGDISVPLLRRTVLTGELEMLAAVDTGRTLRFINTEDLARWEGVSEDDVFFFARENLRALSGEMQLQALADADGKPAAVIIASGDSHDAARLVMPELYNRLSEVLGPELLVGVPNRDFMIVLNTSDDELVSNVAAQVSIDAKTQPYPISGKLYRLTREGIEHAH